MPKISVIVPVYKVEQYLRRCVDSILAQTFTDFELILVDDGSPDNCPEICDEYAVNDSRIHVIHQANGGLSAARNTGIDWVFANSNSEWLSFIDSDDYAHPQMLEVLYNGLIKNNVKVSVCAYQQTTLLEKFDKICSADFSVCKGMDFYANDESNVNAIVTWGKLYCKELFEDIRYPIDRIHEDEFVTYKILYKAGDIAFCKNTLYFYFVNDNSITQSPYSLKRMDSLAAWEEREKWLKYKRLNEYRPWATKQLFQGYWKHYRHTAQNSEYEQAHKMIIKKMRRVLISKRKYADIDIKKYAHYYEAAFPRFMNFYWKKEIFKTKLNEKGLGFCISKTFKYLFRR